MLITGIQYRTPEETWNWHMSKEARLDVLNRYFPRFFIFKKYGNFIFSNLPKKFRIFLRKKYKPEFQGFPYRFD